MGTVTTTIEVGDPQGRNFQEIELEVDTGSTYTALPREMLQALGVPINRSEQARLADGSQQRPRNYSRCSKAFQLGLADQQRPPQNRGGQRR